MISRDFEKAYSGLDNVASVSSARRGCGEERHRTQEEESEGDEEGEGEVRGKREERVHEGERRGRGGRQEGRERRRRGRREVHVRVGGETRGVAERDVEHSDGLSHL